MEEAEEEAKEEVKKEVKGVEEGGEREKGDGKRGVLEGLSDKLQDKAEEQRMRIAGIVNLTTKKIYGVEEGSLGWYHEQGHIKFNESEMGTRLSFYGQNFLIITIEVLVIHLFFPYFFVKLVAASSIILALLIDIFEEVWCWVYAFKEKKKHQLAELSEAEHSAEMSEPSSHSHEGQEKVEEEKESGNSEHEEKEEDESLDDRHESQTE